MDEKKTRAYVRLMDGNIMCVNGAEVLDLNCDDSFVFMWAGNRLLGAARLDQVLTAQIVPVTEG